MQTRILGAAVLAGALSTAPVSAQGRIDRFTESSDLAVSGVAGPPSSAPLTVVLKLAGDPVARVRATAPGKQISDAEEARIVATLRAQQDALEPALTANGATIVAKMQHAVNGIQVQIPANRLAAIATLPGVVGVKPVAVHRLVNSVSVPFIGAPAVWGATPGFHGEGVRVGIIDTGIDYTHANFGGPGTSAAYDAAHAAETAPADPGLFGPSAPKVKGGIDLVGDNYDPGSSNPAFQVPNPDPNPLDCNGHGSHVAGTTAGYGVLANGTTYNGSYDANTDIPASRFRIGPGVAPLADLYAIRVFGCSGSTNVVTQAFDWAVANHMQVVNLSLGSPFGAADTSDAEAATNAEEAGVVVVAAAGNSGPTPYITGSPSTGKEAIAVAAVDSTAAFPDAFLKLPSGATLTALNSDRGVFSDGTSLEVYVLPDTGGGVGGVSLGCNESEYVDAAIAGKLVVARRGTCARINRAIFGQRHGAAAVALINNGSSFGVYEISIPGVSIPFFGIRGGRTTLGADGAALAAANHGTVVLTNGPGLPNPGFRAVASFSSGGPRLGDGRLKPDVAAPGVSIVSTAVGTGNEAAVYSGTSMATPHVAGVAALTVQSHPGWPTDDLRLAIVNTADAGQLVGYSPRLQGSGLVQPVGSTRTSVVARGTDESGNLNFGVAEFARDFHDVGVILVKNRGTSTAKFNTSTVAATGAPHTAVASSSISVPPGATLPVIVSLTVPASTVGDSSAFREVSGRVVLTPVDGANGGVSLAVPYYLVARARSEVHTALAEGFGPSAPSATARVNNSSKAVGGTADFYSLGLRGRNRLAGSTGLRAVGVQAFPTARGPFLVFAVSTFGRWSTTATHEFDVLLDLDGDGTPDVDLFAADFGLVTANSPSGQIGAFVLDLHTGALSSRFRDINPATDSSIIEIPLLASDAGITASNPRFHYTAASYDLYGTASDSLTTPAPFNAFSPSLSTGAFSVLAPGARDTVPLTLDPAEWATTPSLGLMVVATENAAFHLGGNDDDEGWRARQAQLLPVGTDVDDD